MLKWLMTAGAVVSVVRTTDESGTISPFDARAALTGDRWVVPGTADRPERRLDRRVVEIEIVDILRPQEDGERVGDFIGKTRLRALSRSMVTRSCGSFRREGGEKSRDPTGLIARGCDLLRHARKLADVVTAEIEDFELEPPNADTPLNRWRRDRDTSAPGIPKPGRGSDSEPWRANVRRLALVEPFRRENIRPVRRRAAEAESRNGKDTRNLEAA